MPQGQNNKTSAFHHQRSDLNTYTTLERRRTWLRRESPTCLAFSTSLRTPAAPCALPVLAHLNKQIRSEVLSLFLGMVELSFEETNRYAILGREQSGFELLEMFGAANVQYTPQFHFCCDGFTCKIKQAKKGKRAQTARHRVQRIVVHGPTPAIRSRRVRRCESSGAATKCAGLYGVSG